MSLPLITDAKVLLEYDDTAEVLVSFRNDAGVTGDVLVTIDPREYENNKWKWIEAAMRIAREIWGKKNP